MFRRLAEAYDIPVEPIGSIISGNVIQPNPIEYPNIVRESTIDQLLSFKNPNAVSDVVPVISTAPIPNTTPLVPVGYIEEEPVQDTTQPDYKKWFFDQQLAKKEMMMEKCKSLKAFYTEDDNLLKSGYDEGTSGVSLDVVGKELYPGLRVIPRIQEIPVMNRSCEMINGHPSAECIQRQVMGIDISEKNAVDIALGGLPTLKEDISMNPSVKIFHRVVQPPIRMDTVKKGTKTVDLILQELGSYPVTTPVKANTLTREEPRPSEVKEFDFCADLPDSTLPPYDLTCLQKLFRSMGGLPAGKSYPSEDNMIMYNNKQNLGAVKQYIETFLKNKSSKELRLQLEAILALYGITPESIVKRAPYQPGVEVFWFLPGPNNQVAGLLRRTIERNILQFPYMDENTKYCSVLQLTDVRKEEDVKMTFDIKSRDGFIVSVNQPVDGEKLVIDNREEDKKGLFGSMKRDGKGVYSSKECTVFRGLMPNMMKLYYQDMTDSILIQGRSCDGVEVISPFFRDADLSLTCERHAPFLAFEVEKKTMEFEELRNPALFGQMIGRTGLEYHTRTEEGMSVPGKKGFVRLNSARSSIHLPNIAYSCWGTFTMAIRLQSMPVKETLLHVMVGDRYYSVVAKPDNGSNARLYLEHTVGEFKESRKPLKGKQKGPQIQTVSTDFKLTVNTWYLITLRNLGTGFNLSCNSFDNLIQFKGMTNDLTTEADGLLHFQTISPDSIRSCHLLIGTNGFTNQPSIYSTTSCFYDIAWLHFFDYVVTSKEIYREAIHNWIYTAFPDAPYSYKVNLMM